MAITGGNGSGGGGGSDIAVLDEGVNLTSAATSIDFVGAGVTATAVGDSVTVTIPGSTPGDWDVTTKTANYTILGTDTVILADATTASFTLTLPTAVGRTGKYYVIKKIDSSTNTVTIDADSTQTLDDGLTAVLTDQYEAVIVFSDGSNWFIT